MEVTIDGRKLELEEAVTALEAARQVGITIPTLCWHPRVSVIGACRLCMIEVEGINRLLAACTTQVSDGMNILTDTPQLRKVRETMLELLLCRHPLDCPTCVKGGECQLQELAYRHASPQNRFPENPAPYAVQGSSPFVERDAKKCVVCRRCIRVCREVRGVTVLGANERGYHKLVGSYFQQPLNSDFQEPYNCEFCGACIDICPVGALNSKVRKFRARTWEGTTTDSVCPFCSVGCLVSLQVKENELVRTVPKEGPNNEDQACFRGRFGTDYVNATSRLVTPFLRRDGGLDPAGPAEAAAFAAAALSAGKKVKALISSSLTEEEVRAACDFTAALAPDGKIAAVDTLGMYESKIYDSCAGAGWDDLEGADLVVVAGQDFTVFEPVAGVRIRLARQKSGAGLVVIDSRDALLGTEADLWLRPPGTGLGLLLGALLHELAEVHGGRLRSAPPPSLLDGVPGRDRAGAEKDLGLEEGAIAGLAATIAAGEKVVFAGHRGWHDEHDHAARLMTVIDGLLSGADGKILYFGCDANSRGAAAACDGETDGDNADVLLLFGADPLGTALPAAPAAAAVRGAGTVIAFDAFMTDTAAAADAVFPLPHFSEKNGTFVSATGLKQQVCRAMEPPAGVAPLWDNLDAIAEEAGQSLSFAPSLQGKPEATSSPAAVEAAGDVSLPGPGEKMLLLRAVHLAGHRLGQVEETALLMPQGVVEINPADLEGLGLDDGDPVVVVSGSGRLERTVKSDLKVPSGQVHVPFDGGDGECVSFAAAAERPDGWPAVTRRLTGIEKRAGEGAA